MKGEFELSGYSRVLSNHYLGEIQDLEADMGPRMAGEMADAHIDAGTRYHEGDRIEAGREAAE